jgi:hypothetical protein
MPHDLDARIVNPKKFALVVGNARSGTTIVGSILDSHPQMLCANETMASMTFWQGLDRQTIFDEISRNSHLNAISGRPSQGYSYAIETDSKVSDAITVVADKIWNPALLFVAGNPHVLCSLEETTGCAVMLVHCVRNPFDVIATMHRRSGAPLRDRIRWYTMHCEAAQMLIERGDNPLLTVRHEEMIAVPGTVSAALFEWLGFPTDDAHLGRISDRVMPHPNRTRQAVDWPMELRQQVETIIARFSFLEGYSLQS